MHKTGGHIEIGGKMKKIALIGVTCAALAGCVKEKPPTPALPEGAQTKSFTYVGESFLRGVNGSYNTSPSGRKAAILDVTYGITCLADDAQSRFNKSKQMLDETYVVAPLYFNNPREKGYWFSAASRAIVDTGCIVDRFGFEEKTTDVIETTLWAFRNKVPPAR